jgi:hypothetical protein
MRSGKGRPGVGEGRSFIRDLSGGSQPDRFIVANLLQSVDRECLSMTNFVIYLIGTILVVAGLAYGASRLGVSQTWIIAGALVIIGIGLMGGIVKTRQKDPAS